MEYFTLCSKIIQEEKRKCNLDQQEIIRRTVEFSICDNFFESPYDRCAFMYKYATCIISFTKDCIYKFLKECPMVNDMLLKWKVQQSLHFCSFSHGPALDYLSFCIALSENVEINLQPSFNIVNVISNSAQWKHAINFMVQSVEMGYLSSFPVSTFCDNFDVNQNPRLAFNNKQRIAVQKADVIFMVKTLNFSKPDEYEGRKKYFQNIIAAMKADSYLFCIDTKPSISAMFDIFSQIAGQLIYGPELNAYQLTEKFPDNFKDIYGCLPVMSARGNFFVWKKMHQEFQVPNLQATSSENFPLNPDMFFYNKATGLSQYSLVDKILKHDITTEIDEVSYTCEKSTDLFNNQNYSHPSLRNIENITTSEQDDVQAKSTSSNTIDPKFKPYSILDQLFNKTFSEKSESFPKATFSIDDISPDASLDNNKENNTFDSQKIDLNHISKNIQDLTSEPGFSSYEDNMRSNSVASSNCTSISFTESPVVINKNLNSTKLNDNLIQKDSSHIACEFCVLPGSNELDYSEDVQNDDSSSILNDSLNSQESKFNLVKSRRRKRRTKKRLNVSSNSKIAKLIKSNTLVPSIINTVPNSCTSSSKQTFSSKVSTSIEIAKNKSENIEKEIKNNTENVGFLNPELVKNCQLLNQDQKIAKNGNNNSLFQTSLRAPQNKKLEPTKKYEENDCISYLSPTSVSTDADDGSVIQLLTNKINTLVNRCNQILNKQEIDASLEKNKACQQYNNHLCSCLSSDKNVGNYENYLQNTNIASTNASKADYENVEEKNSYSNLESKTFCLPPSTLCCACKFREVHRCACFAMSNCPSHSCFHCAKQNTFLRGRECDRCIPNEQASSTVPNIVIPLQNISEDALAQILAILKISNAHSPN